MTFITIVLLEITNELLIRIWHCDKKERDWNFLLVEAASARIAQNVLKPI